MACSRCSEMGCSCVEATLANLNFSNVGHARVRALFIHDKADPDAQILKIDTPPTWPTGGRSGIPINVTRTRHLSRMSISESDCLDARSGYLSPRAGSMSS